ncbi:M1 family metallopeptidase [Bryobacter aggregatus]|uniref:M1 family metallopeptidase n=1 Tax=Bryobacter aggregatus TaxID=360054 RepID=UPI00055F1477|nr:M1 family aminopeptidase [Bryobacter aggregatus]
MIDVTLALLFLAAAPDPQPGISEALAAERARRIRDIHYELHLQVPAQREQPIVGTAKIRFSLQQPEQPVVLDFAPGADHILSVSVPYRWVNGHLVLRKGAEPIEIRFRAGDAPLNRNPDYFYSLFVPARAHFAIPCFDQPDLKTRFSVTMQVPAGWQAISNAAPGVATEPLPTYLLSVAAGKFQVEQSGRLRLFHRETDRKKVDRNLKAIFELHERAIRAMEEYTGLPYAFGKFDFVALPAFQFGGMEHPGAIDYKAESLFLDESATQQQLLGRASLIAHETAHMWFGDLVTMKWFNDVWLKEVFANFMAAKIVNPSFPQLNHELRFYLSHYRTAYDVDRTAGANAIRQHLANLNDAGSMYGPIIYQKAPIVMRQLEALLGETKFRNALRVYLKRYSFSNVTWDQLITILDEQTPADLKTWSKIWIDTAGRPPAGKTKSYGHFVLPDGYGSYTLDAHSRTYLLAHLPEIPDALTRAIAWGTLWENMLDGKVAERDLQLLALAWLPRESDELNIQRTLTDLTRLSLWNREPRVETLLRERIETAPSRSLKAAYFEAYSRTASSPEAMDWLTRVWKKELLIPDLPLAENDSIALASELALRGIDVRQQQLAKIQNPDRKAEFAFVLPALDADPAVRAQFFRSLLDRKNRAHESWVLDALRYLHHPSRAKASEPFLLPSLVVLQEIQKTGDIFFPQRWISTTLRGHRDRESATVVRRFLATLPPHYPARLRLTILAAADELFRFSAR